jgi:hypothetical protein
MRSCRRTRLTTAQCSRLWPDCALYCLQCLLPNDDLTGHSLCDVVLQRVISCESSVSFVMSQYCVHVIIPVVYIENGSVVKSFNTMQRVLESKRLYWICEGDIQYNLHTACTSQMAIVRSSPKAQFVNSNLITPLTHRLAQLYTQ